MMQSFGLELDMHRMMRTAGLHGGGLWMPQPVLLLPQVLRALFRKMSVYLNSV